MDHITIVVADLRNGPIRKDGSNIDLPPEGQAAMLNSLRWAEVIVEVQADTVLVRGVNPGVVLLCRTKSPAQMSAEKAAGDLAVRKGDQPDDLAIGEHPVEQKFARVWDGSVPSGKPAEGGLKGY